jgi:hypothetical protein
MASMEVRLNMRPAMPGRYNPATALSLIALSSTPHYKFLKITILVLLSDLDTGRAR